MNEAAREARDIVRFHSMYVINPQTGCWEWKHNIQRGGYGHFKWNGKAQNAHRVSYMLHNGDIQPGLYVLHRCDNRKCVNPEHLSVGTAQDNRNDMNAKMRHAHGERVNTAKLTEADVKRMYDLLDLGKGTPTVARMFGVSIANAWNIKTGKSWQHLYKARYGSNDAV